MFDYKIWNGDGQRVLLACNPHVKLSLLMLDGGVEL